MFHSSDHKMRALCASARGRWIRLPVHTTNRSPLRGSSQGAHPFPPTPPCKTSQYAQSTPTGLRLLLLHFYSVTIKNGDSEIAAPKRTRLLVCLSGQYYFHPWARSVKQTLPLRQNAVWSKPKAEWVHFVRSFLVTFCDDKKWHKRKSCKLKQKVHILICSWGLPALSSRFRHPIKGRPQELPQPFVSVISVISVVLVVPVCNDLHFSSSYISWKENVLF